jgi:hypothetical protein
MFEVITVKLLAELMLDSKHPRQSTLHTLRLYTDCMSTERSFNERRLEVATWHILRKSFKVTSIDSKKLNIFVEFVQQLCLFTNAGTASINYIVEYFQTVLQRF